MSKETQTVTEVIPSPENSSFFLTPASLECSCAMCKPITTTKIAGLKRHVDRLFKDNYTKSIRNIENCTGLPELCTK